MSEARPGKRRRRRSVRRWLMRPSVLAAAGGGLLAAVLAGVTMGNAAVEGINPVHYRAPPAPSQKARATVEPSPDMLARRRPSYGELYGWDAGEMARSTMCGEDCGDGSGYSAQVPDFNSRDELAEANRAAQRAIDRAFAEESDAAMNRKDDRRIDPRGIDDKAEPGFIEETIGFGDSD